MSQKNYPLNLIYEIGRVNVSFDKIPDSERKIGRNCLALSETEDLVIQLLEDKAKELFKTYEVPVENYCIEQDAFGNLFVTLYGEEKDSPAIASGSHIDSVLDGGQFDGVVGVVSAYRFLENLIKSKQVPKKNYKLVIFRAEESSPKTGVCCLGSRIATGTIDEDELNKIQYKLCGGSEVSLKDFIEKKYGVDKWLNILVEIKNPPLTKETVAVMEELHIEQSRVCEITHKNLGIVIDGIGGARREKIQIPVEHLLSEKIEIKDNSHTQFNLCFIGEEAHTGGTPPNPNFIQKNQEIWYRRDALVSASYFLEQLATQCQKQKINFEIKEFKADRETGFTTVPKKQILEIVAGNKQVEVLQKIINSLNSQIQKDQDIDIEVVKNSLLSGDYNFWNKKKITKLAGISLVVEKNIREAVNVQGGIGKIRGTVTDFILDRENGLRFNIDYREVDQVELEKIVEKIDQEIQQILKTTCAYSITKKDNPKIWRTLSVKPSTKISAELTKIKKAIAGKLGLTFIEMPSMAGHDAVSMSQADIPTTMIFVKHDGVSHNSSENITVENYSNAEYLSHAFLAEQLGVKFK